MSTEEKKFDTQNLPTKTYFWPLKRYQDLYNSSLSDPEAFWAKHSDVLSWEKPWERVLDWNPPYARWFVGGKLNMSYQCVDRHAKSWRKSKVAIYWEGENGDTQTISYSDLYENVNRYASVLKKLGIGKGDKVTVYLPMIPEMVYILLACNRVGAVHNVIFSGFSSQSIADRVNDSGSKMIVTASGGHRRGKILPLKEIVDEAVKSTPTIEHVLVIKYTGHEVVMDPTKDVWAHDLLKDADKYVAPEAMESTDPLFILYTSGTTGKPKGILHGTGGYGVWACNTLKWAFKPTDESVFWCTADVGWITGHTYVVYAPLALGLTQVIYEGAPDYPSVDRWWEIIDKYGVSIFYTSPTAIRMFMRHGEELPAKHDLSTLEMLGSVGEPINPEAWEWYYKNIGHENCPISDTWWQTETGGFMITPCPGIQSFPLKPGSATLPLPGVDPVVVDAEGKILPANETGFIAIRKPWPGIMLGIYNGDELYKKTYWSRFPGWYCPGDFSMKDSDGYLWLLGRADEVIKVAGHRISTAELEHALVGHSSVAEAAVASRPDEVKGEAIVVFVTLKKNVEASAEVKRELTHHLRSAIGTIATPEEIIFVEKLPKTRSGKIMRRLLKAVANEVPIGDTTTLDDETSVNEARAAFDELLAARKHHKH
ncbi:MULTISPECIES: acetate--CoA ligase [Dehalococcoides]|jgi:acetyl-CoA synthetase|uniref:Acetate--CoA ligase n=2 Tax=Dehalococcoides mccartyi TaxID=61435 RepID=A0A142VAR3_9CHLR|nr:acetate--CoA ligase [Dehalococcoides mccartyi]AGG08165.1 acetyl-coenzyme A synthetase [Dehalococcoides mccartyi BTF08]AMU86862.1 acetyl-CoA synthetase [Dehalococcoides mccartyi]AOV99651.1 acetyl-coenzyme A synthetase [Dehalococcoides mccartyi]AQU06208.1 acetyl-coenzyme A synthetase [Dehalococcoides mccartyi]AQU07650.1 acetyl-coenzyme A synthetase [Dehalococcoides mccartyi]